MVLVVVGMAMMIACACCKSRASARHYSIPAHVEPLRGKQTYGVLFAAGDCNTASELRRRTCACTPEK